MDLKTFGMILLVLAAGVLYWYARWYPIIRMTRPRRKTRSEKLAEFDAEHKKRTIGGDMSGLDDL